MTVKWHVTVMADGREYRFVFTEPNLAAYCYAHAILNGFQARVRQVQARELVGVTP